MSSLSINKLKDLCENYKNDIVDGPFGSNLKRKDFTKSGIPVLKIQNIKENYILYKNFDYVTEEKYNVLKRHSFISGDIVMTKLGNPLGVSAIVKNVDKGLIVADLVRIRAKKVDTKYLCYYLNSPDNSYFINSQQKGTTRPRIRLDVIRELPVPTPSLSEQKRIVSILDKAFEKIEKAKKNAEKNVENSKKLFESYLKLTFNKLKDKCENKFINEIAQNLDSRRVPVTKKDRINGEYPYFGASGIVDYVNKYIFDEELLLVSEDGANLLARTYPIAFSISGKTWVNNHAHVLKFQNTETQKFVEFFLNSMDLKAYISGMAQPKLNQKSLNSIKIPFPPLSTQKEIVDMLYKFAQQTKEIRKSYQQKFFLLEELKKSILHKAFAGEL